MHFMHLNLLNINFIHKKQTTIQEIILYQLQFMTKCKHYKCVQEQE